MSIKCANERGFDDFLARHQNTESDTSSRRSNNAPEGGKALLSCGSGGIGPMSTSSEHCCSPIQVASVSIDTSRLFSPRVLLTFSCIIGLPADIEVTLNFIIVKTIDCGVPQTIGGTHTFIEKAKSDRSHVVL